MTEQANLQGWVMKNALTIDVEDYFHVSAFEGVISRRDWESYPPRVAENTRRVLDLLDELSLKATFFVLGWVAERSPDLVRSIAARGHEVACHGYGHERIYTMTPENFRRDVIQAKKILEDITGSPVNGYRAPSYSITKRSVWALDVLIEEGFSYDSSIFPIIHDTYGIPGAERFPHLIERPSGTILEFPLTTLKMNILGKDMVIPIAGGGYLRLLPVSIIRNGLRRINGRDKQPAVLYFHPWEIDPDQPRIKASFKSTFRHYLNLDTTEDKLRHLLPRLPFGTMREALGEWDAAEASKAAVVQTVGVA